jgi:hypothetical protein
LQTATYGWDPDQGRREAQGGAESVTRRKLPRRIIRPVVQAGPATEAGKVCRGCAGGAIPPAYHPRVDGPEGRAEQLPAAPTLRRAC